MQWYYIKDGDRFGPVEADALLAMVADGRLHGDDLVWNEAMGDDWAAVDAVPELHPAPEPADVTPVAAPEPAAFTPEPDVVEELPPPLPDGIEEEEYYAGAVSCTTPVSRAWQRMVSILFAPFDISKWFAMGVSAWLATLGEGGGGSFNMNSSNFGDSGSPTMPGEVFGDMMEKIKEFMNEYGSMVAIGVVVLVVLLVSLGIVFLWLRSRGKLMLLDNVIHNRAEIGEAWHRTARLGNSLFRWSLVYGFICSIAWLILLAAAFVGIAVPCYRAEGWVPETVPIIVGLVIVWIPLAVVVAMVNRFREDFVVPIMYRQDVLCSVAWGQFLALFRPRVGKFIVYLLFRVLLVMGAGVAVGAFILITCCLGSCLLSIPYLGAVVALPITVFFRAYSLEYMAQFGKDYRLFMWR